MYRNTSFNKKTVLVCIKPTEVLWRLSRLRSTHGKTVRHCYLRNQRSRCNSSLEEYIYHHRM